MNARLLLAALAAVGLLAMTRAATVEARAARVMIHAIDMEDASPKEVFEYLRERSKEADPEGKGINMLFRFSPAGLKAFTQNTITLKLNDVPMTEVVRYVCIATGLLYKYDQYTLMLFDTAAAQPMETRVYQLKAGVLESRHTRDKPEELDGFGSSNGNGNNRN